MPAKKSDKKSTIPTTHSASNALHRAMLAWYDANARVLPWRVPPKNTVPKNPYHVWLAEIMLQQTTVPAVKSYYEKFITRWPNVEDLAAAELNDVLAAWAGLGYYARARNLHACAKTVVREHGGRFPKTVADLRTLPGIGAYTSAAVAAIAYDATVLPVDGNIARILARLYALETPLAKAKTALERLAETLAPKSRAGDVAQAFMDLGTAICTPPNPDCGQCPIAKFCLAYQSGRQQDLPVKIKKAKTPERFASAFVITRSDGAVLLRRRAAKGLLGGMLEVPSSPWGDAPAGEPKVVLSKEPTLTALKTLANKNWQKIDTPVIHVFTHFRLTVLVYHCEVAKSAMVPEGFAFYARENLHALALPSLMRKIILGAVLDKK